MKGNRGKEGEGNWLKSDPENFFSAWFPETILWIFESLCEKLPLHFFLAQMVHFLIDHLSQTLPSSLFFFPVWMVTHTGTCFT